MGVEQLEAVRFAVGRVAHAIGELETGDPAGLKAAVFGSTQRTTHIRTTKEGSYPEESVPEGTVRGLNGVRATVETRDRDRGEPGLPALVSAAVYSGYRDYKGTDPTGWDHLHDALEEAELAILEYRPLLERLQDYIGQRTADLPDADEHFSDLNETQRAFLILTTLATRLSTAAEAEGDDWEAIGHRVGDDLSELAARTHDRYVLRGYLNSPPVAPNESHALGEFEWGSTGYHMRLVHASDDLLERAFAERSVPNPLPVALSRANSVAEVEFTVPVGVTSEEASNHAEQAVELINHLEDALRLLRGEDLGVVMIAPERQNWASPRLPEDAFWDRNEDALVYFPKRGFFGDPASGHLEADKIESISAVLDRLVEGVSVHGFGLALRRFRATYDRYAPGDYEFLLDSAIAFEALFLNDGDNKELRYKLANRVARFLADDLETRKSIAKRMKDLYDVRSKIAHGDEVDVADMGQSKSKKRKFANAVYAGSHMLRKALHTFVLNGGPGNQQAAADFWKDMELS